MILFFILVGSTAPLRTHRPQESVESVAICETAMCETAELLFYLVLNC